MKKTHIFRGNQHVEAFVCDGRRYSKWQIFMFKTRRLARRVMIVGGVMSLGGWLLYGGVQYGITTAKPITVLAEVVREVPIKSHAPIMDKIAQCESGNSHIDKKTGQVFMRGNTNKTVDVGRYQLNSVWYKKASELGLDITKEVDNEKMAYWIFENRGTGDWKYSQECWSK